MRARIGRTKYAVWFQHGEQEIEISQQPTRVRTITCNIAPVEDGQKTEQLTPIATGTSFCSPSDDFNGIVGRKIAFERAVGATEGKKKVFNRTQRTKLWDWYRTTHRLVPGRSVQQNPA